MKTIVVGAGIAGLSAATFLAQGGQSVTVLEAQDKPGGRIVRMTRGSDSIDAGAQGIHSNYREMLGLVEYAGLTEAMKPSSGSAQYLGRDGIARISRGNADLVKMMGPRGAVDLTWFRTRYFTLAKRFRQFEIARDIPSYDNVPASDAFNWAGESFHDYVLRPMMHGMTNTTPPHTNLYHVINALRLRLTTRIFGLSTGLLTLAERLAARIDIRYETPVERILYESGKVTGVLLKSGETLKCDHVIVATPIGHAAGLVPDEMKFARDFLSTFPHTPLPLVFFFLDRPLDVEPYVTFGHPLRETIYNVAVNHARKTPYMVPSGNAIISAWPCYPGAMEMIDKSDGDVVRQALKDLDAFFPGISNWVLEARVMRHKWGVARYSVGMHRRILDFKKEAAAIKSISFIGNDYDGVHMECGVRGARRAADRVIAQASGQ